MLQTQELQLVAGGGEAVEAIVFHRLGIVREMVAVVRGRELVG